MVDLVTPSPLVAQAGALQARLALLFPPPVFQHEFVPARLTGANWSNLTNKCPFVGLGWSLVEPQGQTGRVFSGGVRWAVFLVVKNQAGGFAPRFLGDRLGHGLLDLVGAAIAGLHGWTIPQIGTVSLVSAGNAYSEDWSMENGACAMIEIEVKTEIPVSSVFTAADVTPHEFAALVSTWRFDGGDTVAQTTDPAEAGRALKHEDRHDR